MRMKKLKVSYQFYQSSSLLLPKLAVLTVHLDQESLFCKKKQSLQ
jgi:hypothetical protein